MPASAIFTPADIMSLRLTSLRLTRRLRKHAGIGLTPSQQSALTTLDRHGAMRVGQLAEREQIGKSSTTRLVAKLEKLGLAERTQDSADGRSWFVALTDRGADLLADSSERADAYLARQFAELSPGDQSRLLAALPVMERLLEVKA